MSSEIRKIYENPETGLYSAEKLYKKLKDKGISLKDIKDFLKSQETHQIHLQTTKPHHYFPIYSKSKNDIWQLDLMDVSPWSSQNKGINFILVCIDIYTRFLRVTPLKNKTIHSVVDAMRQLIKEEKPNTIQVDQGSEFISREFKQLAKTNNITIRYTDVGNHKALGIVDRVCRTLRDLIERYFTMYDTRTYINVLDKLIFNYNHTHHSGINSTPAKPDLDYIKHSYLEKYQEALHNETSFNIGEKVRFVINRRMFQKGTQAKWSKTIGEIIKKNSHSYILNNGQSYMFYELQPIGSVTEAKVIKTRSRANQPTIEDMRKERSVKRKLKKEGIDTENILKTKRTRQPTDRLRF